MNIDTATAFSSRLKSFSDVLINRRDQAVNSPITLNFGQMPQEGNEYLHTLAPDLSDGYKGDMWSRSRVIIARILWEECSGVVMATPCKKERYEIIVTVMPRSQRRAAIHLREFLHTRFNMVSHIGPM